MNPPLIRSVDLTKDYQLGDTHGAGLARRVAGNRARRIRRGDGPVGFGQIDLHEPAGLPRPAQRRRLLAGRRVGRALSDDALAALRNRRIGFVFQHFNLLARTTALDNVALPLLYRGLPAAERHAHAAHRLRQVGLAERMDHHPAQLSGGQQQRVAIARALVNDPALVLADEPTGALDTRTGIEIMALLQQLNRDGITIVLVTHEHDIAAYADRIIHFRDGRVVDDLANKRRDASADFAALPILTSA